MAVGGSTVSFPTDPPPTVCPGRLHQGSNTDSDFGWTWMS